MDADYVNEVRYKMGQVKLEEFMRGPSAGDSVMSSIRGVAPHMERQVMEFAFGDVLSRPGLSPQVRELLILAVLTAIGAEVELRVHTNVALNIGCTREQIVEAVSQQAVYVGFPLAINGIKVLEKVFAERDAQGVSN